MLGGAGGSQMLGGAGGSNQLLSCQSAPPSQTDNALSDLMQGFVFDQAKGKLLEHLGVDDPVSKIETLVGLINGIGENLERFNNATSVAPNLQLQPLMGLVVLLAGLEILKELINEFVPVPGLEYVTGAFCSVVASVAWRAAELFITHFLVIDAAILGIEIPPDCVINLQPPD